MAHFALWFPPMGTFGIALAVLGVFVSIMGFKGILRVVLVSACVLLGVGEVVSIIKADSAHKAEVRSQQTDIENLRGELHKSDTERQVAEAYLKAKLEDSYQFGPVLMKFAQTNAEFERKQYETKAATGKGLYHFTMDVVKKIREFSQKYRLAESQLSYEQMKNVGQAQNEAERWRLWNEGTQKEMQLYYSRDNEFRTSILSDAIFAKNELQKRKVPEPILNPIEKSDVDMVLKGILVGPRPELNFADYLELMARQIPTK